MLCAVVQWTVWSLLVALALYDLCAVLTPCGPLRKLVELAQERQDPIPGLLYEAEVGNQDRNPAVVRDVIARPQARRPGSAGPPPTLQPGQAPAVIPPQASSGNPSSSAATTVHVRPAVQRGDVASPSKAPGFTHKPELPVEERMPRSPAPAANASRSAAPVLPAGAQPQPQFEVQVKDAGACPLVRAP